MSRECIGDLASFVSLMHVLIDCAKREELLGGHPLVDDELDCSPAGTMCTPSHISWVLSVGALIRSHKELIS